MMWLNAPAALVLLTLVTALTPLAHASPPDSLWIAGVYDGGDLDDAVLAAVWTDATAGSPLGAGSARPPLVRGNLVPVSGIGADHCSLRAVLGRAPPVA